MSMPTKDQWAAIEKELSGLFGRVELKCDGFSVVASIQTIAPLQLGILVYVNGWIKGEWVKGEAEEAKKFHREMRRFLYPASRREEARKKLKIRRLDASLRDWYTGVAEKYVATWAPYWTNAKAFTRHLRKTCTDIEVVSIGHKV